MDKESEEKKLNHQAHKLNNTHLGLPVHYVIVLLISTIVTAIFVDLFSIKYNYWNWFQQHDSEKLVSEDSTAPKYAIYTKNKAEEHLIHVVNVLHRLGYQRVPLEDNWDLLWAHDYPFKKLSSQLKRLDQNQMVNHFPGCGFLTNKVDLSTTSLPFLPKAFRLPSQRLDFLNYIEDHPNALFVEKHNEHRQIAIRNPKDINLYSNITFVQEFVQNPFLVDGYKFDIGVYVVITSIDPLRLYIYSDDVLFRYCPVKYYPFNSSVVDKYVVGDNYLPTWQVPSLRKYYNDLGGSMRGAFDSYVRDQNLNPSLIWQQVEDIIRRTVLIKEQDIEIILRPYKNRNFFDLMRFDLIIDDQLKVHLMEANMSPNLSSAHFKPNSLLYEQILYSVMNLVGVGSPVKNISVYKERFDDVTEMITSDKNLATNLNTCVMYHCARSCNNEKCDLCLPCLTGNEYEILKKAHREHLHRISVKRIFPKPIIEPENFDIAKEVQNMTKRNAWLTRWYYYKCLFDSTWCN